MSSRFLTLAIGAILIVIFFLPVESSAGSFPKDGTFKRLPDSRDYWFYIDQNNWEIEAPDKWTHMMGSLSSTLLFGKVMNKYAAGALVLTLGAFKEYDDAYREGWSYRDLIADALGVGGALFSTDRVRLLCDYSRERVVLKVYLVF